MNWRAAEIVAHSQILSVSLITIGMLMILLSWRFEDHRKFSKITEWTAVIMIIIVGTCTAVAWTADRDFELTGDDFQRSHLLKVKKYHPLMYNYSERMDNGRSTFIYELKPGYIRNTDEYYTQSKTYETDTKQRKSVDVLIYTPKTKNWLLKHLVQDMYQCYGHNQDIDNSAIVIRTTYYQKVR